MWRGRGMGEGGEARGGGDRRAERTGRARRRRAAPSVGARGEGVDGLAKLGGRGEDARLGARLHIPLQHRAVLGGGEERPVVAGERDGRDGQLVPAEEAGGDGGGAARRLGNLLLQAVRNRILILLVPVVLHLELGRLLLDDLRARCAKRNPSAGPALLESALGLAMLTRLPRAVERLRQMHVLRK